MIIFHITNKMAKIMHNSIEMLKMCKISRKNVLCLFDIVKKQIDSSKIERN